MKNLTAAQQKIVMKAIRDAFRAIYGKKKAR